MASGMNLPFLGALPIHMELRTNCDNGTPLENWNASPTLANELDTLCRNLAGQISIATMSGELVQPTLSVT